MRLNGNALQHKLAGSSAALGKVLAFIAKAAPVDSTVLIEGESGTGKELVARALHQNSRRCTGPFVPVNCAALPENLLESELFGHEKGAFTGAMVQQKGKFELAAGGTLFLDEIGELSASIQAKLLRALQEQTIDRVGGREPIRISIRLVAATNRDLPSGVAAGEFRQDLYYRLKVLSIRTPALRDRPEDIPELIALFIEKYSRQTGRAVRGVSPDADAILRNYEWPGNVRQLQNVLEQAVVLGSGEMIGKEDLPEEVLQTVPQSYRARMHRAKREIFRDAFARAKGDYKQAARYLNLNPRSVHRYLRDLGLSDLLT